AAAADVYKRQVVVRASLARYETVERIGGSGDRGHTKYGKRAAENIGVSIVREGRELDLDKAWASSYDPTDRWWGVEVSFPSALDEVFGVTNNKQSAANFSRMAQFSLEKEAGMSGVSEKEFLEHVEEEGDLRLLLAYTAHYVQEQIKLMRLQVKKQTAGRRKRQRHDQPSTADLATAKFRERAKDRPTEADSRELTEESRKEFERDLEHDKHYPKPLAKQIADEAFARKHKVVFLTKRMDSYAFFSVENHHGGLTPIVFNSSHPFYERLLESLDPQELGDETDADLMARIHRAADTLKLLFAAWARYEMEEMQRRIQMPDMRQEWGKMARFFLTEEDDE
ncbi:MAG: hypothetical protein MPJ22_04015, partial [Pirellulales bacterium]|nr:hypothetical protein [Pirellulales bacterium]